MLCSHQHMIVSICDCGKFLIHIAFSVADMASGFGFTNTDAPLSFTTLNAAICMIVSPLLAIGCSFVHAYLDG